MSDHFDGGAFEREQSEPHEMPRGMPALMAVLLGGVGAWGASYIWYEAGELSALGDRRTFATPDADDEQTGADGAEVDGQVVYASICQACHQANGLGVSGAFPPLAKSSWVNGAAEMPVAIVLKGLQGEIEVLGTTYNGMMPPFGEQLSDAEIAAVVSYVRSSWGNRGGEVTASEVAKLRASLVESGMLSGGAAVRALAP
ncbi:MAG: cytochrome c [Myxococcota bacterium]